MNETMQQVNRFLIDNGLATFIRWWNVMTNPPLCITEEQLAEGFEIIDRALDDRRRRDGGLTVARADRVHRARHHGQADGDEPARGRRSP